MRHGTWIAKSIAGTVIAAGARPLCDLWLHLRPHWRPVSPSGIEDDRRRAAAHAVEIQPKSTGVNELAGLRVNHVGGNAACSLLAGGGCGEERCQEQESYLLHLFSSLLLGRPLRTPLILLLHCQAMLLHCTFLSIGRT